MIDGFIRVAAVTPEIKVADPAFNGERIREQIREAYLLGAKIIVFPELCITGYTCGDLFWHPLLLEAAKQELLRIAEYTTDLDAIVFVGLPVQCGGKLYNAAAAISHGEVLGLVPKTHLPNYNEFYERRHFTPASQEPLTVVLGSDEGGDPVAVQLHTEQLFVCRQMPGLKIGVELCEDLWVMSPPGIRHAQAGAVLIVNLSASDEITGKDTYRRSLVTGQSARLLCGYIYASAGDGESTQDVVYSGHNLIAENGTLLAESRRFLNESIYSEIDIDRLARERAHMTTFDPDPTDRSSHAEVYFDLQLTETKLTRYIDPAPFVPADHGDRAKRCEEILNIQAMGLKKRLAHTGAKTAVIGISGGLDSTLALLVTVRAFSYLKLPPAGILAVTMPGFGTTDRTYENAVALIGRLGATLREIPITDAVTGHFADIGHDGAVHDVTYENGQARERTQILMDLANQTGGLVIGTGDLSEMALGWATYNGDHMSMYAVNVSVPKTLVRHLIRYYADQSTDTRLQEVLFDVLDTPVSPELLPPEDGRISQKTEDLVGPYELHDFFLYHFQRLRFPPRKILRLAKLAFAGQYEDEVIEKWLRTFIRRYFQQQFKRSCLPDGPKVGTVSISPRGDLRMPSDASAALWLCDLEDTADGMADR